MPKIHNPVLWNYFEPNREDKTAECKQCHKQLSYKTTSANLKQHLKIKHVDSYNELHDPASVSVSKPRPSVPKSCNLLIWNYFEKNEEQADSGMADCRLCRKKLSYKTTINNLKQHLKHMHIGSYNEFVAQSESVVVDSAEEDCTSTESDDACDELLKVTDVWSYFDTDSGQRAQCTVCHSTLGNDYEELKAHLKDNHPKLLLQLLQNKDQDSDAASNGDDDNENTYTEIVYLEHEPTENAKIRKEKPKSFAKPAKKRERLHSLYSSDDIPLKKLKKDEENDELGIFIKYITCLLKKLPADVFSNVQIEIINTILKANSQVANTSRSMALNTELINTSSNIITVDGITPISNTMTGHNYTITVAPPNETKTENGK